MHIMNSYNRRWEIVESQNLLSWKGPPRIIHPSNPPVPQSSVQTLLGWDFSLSPHAKPSPADPEPPLR